MHLFDASFRSKVAKGCFLRKFITFHLKEFKFIFLFRQFRWRSLTLFLSRSFLRSNISFGIRNISLIFDITTTDVIQTIVEIINLHSFFCALQIPRTRQFSLHYFSRTQMKYLWIRYNYAGHLKTTQKFPTIMHINCIQWSLLHSVWIVKWMNNSQMHFDEWSAKIKYAFK